MAYSHGADQLHRIRNGSPMKNHSTICFAFVSVTKWVLFTLSNTSQERTANENAVTHCEWNLKAELNVFQVTLGTQNETRPKGPSVSNCLIGLV